MATVSASMIVMQFSSWSRGLAGLMRETLVLDLGMIAIQFLVHSSSTHPPLILHSIFRYVCVVGVMKQLSSSTALDSTARAKLKSCYACRIPKYVLSSCVFAIDRFPGLFLFATTL